MTKFTHPKDAPEGHKWTFRGFPVLEIYDGSEKLLVVYDADGEPCSIRADGKGQTGFDSRVIDAPKEHALWLNVYEKKDGSVFVSAVHETREKADEVAGPDRIHCFEHTFFEGEGL